MNDILEQYYNLLKSFFQKDPFELNQYFKNGDVIELQKMAETRSTILDQDLMRLINLCFYVLMPYHGKNADFAPVKEFTNGRTQCPKDINDNDLNTLKDLLKLVNEDQEQYDLKPYLIARIAHIVKDYSCALNAYMKILDEVISQYKYKLDDNNIKPGDNISINMMERRLKLYANNALAICSMTKNIKIEQDIFKTLYSLVGEIENKKNINYDCYIIELLKIIYYNYDETPRKRLEDELSSTIEQKCIVIAERNEKERASNKGVLEEVVLPAYKIALSQEDYKKKEAKILIKIGDLADHPIIAINKYAEAFAVDPSLKKDPEVMRKYDKSKKELYDHIKKHGERIGYDINITPILEEATKDIEQCENLDNAVDKLFYYNLCLKDQSEEIKTHSKGGSLHLVNSCTINENRQRERGMTYDAMWYDPQITYHGIYISCMINLIQQKFHKDAIESYIVKQIFPDNRKQQCSRVLRFFLQEDFISSVNIGIPQLEHILRELAEKHGILSYTIKSTKNNEGREISEDRMLPMERILEGLQKLDAFKHMKEIFFTLQYLFSEGGLNFRNDIAHGLMDDSNFEGVLPAYICWIINFCIRVFDASL